MLSALIPLLYVQVAPDRVTIRNVRAETVVSAPAQIAIAEGRKPVARAVGEAARQAAAEPGVTLARPFAHPRSLVSDFTAGELLLKALIREAVHTSWLAASPAVVLHLTGDPEGGFTAVEIRAFQEMALGAGASKVTLWQGRPLTDPELRSGVFPTEGKRL